jgi:hypothetical protein
MQFGRPERELVISCRWHVRSSGGATFVGGACVGRQRRAAEQRQPVMSMRTRRRSLMRRPSALRVELRSAQSGGSSSAAC